jgi:hypothetical protein
MPACTQLFIKDEVIEIGTVEHRSRNMTVGSPPLSLKTSRSRPTLSSSLTLWAFACGVCVIAGHIEIREARLSAESYFTGIAALVLFVLAVVIIMHRRIAAYSHRLWYA